MRNLEVAVARPESGGNASILCECIPKDDVRDGGGGSSSSDHKDKKIPLAISIWPKSKIGSEFTIN
jgi:hypothetical protein